MRLNWIAQVKYLDAFGKERTGETKCFSSKEYAEQWASLLSLKRNETVTIEKV